MKEQLISFETAKLAKEKGFIVEVPNYYHPTHGLDDDDYGHKDNYNNPAWSNGYYSAPTQSLLQKWLRDNEKIIVLPQPVGKDNEDFIIYDALIIDHSGDFTTSIDVDGTYEQALEAGLLGALKLIPQMTN